MAESIVKVPKLPRSGFADGEQIADPDGNIWEYNEETKEWFLRGKFDPLPVVTEDQNGLVSPEIYRKLLLIQDLIDKGVSFDVFKLKSSLENPYFFYFQSSDGLIKFIPEDESKLRIEIDRAKLYALLMKKCCIGPKGRVGPQGPKGINGRPASNEIFRVPKIENETTLVISTPVASPIDTPISLRIFNETKTQVAEFLLSLDGSLEFALVEGLEIDTANLEIRYDKPKGILSAKITLITYSGDLSLWRFKARQQGPTGDAGDDGKDYLEIVNNVLEDNSLESNQAIISLRKSGNSNLKFLSAPINTDICVSKLSASENAPLKLKEYMDLKYLASEITTRDCKNIGFFDLAKNFNLSEEELQDSQRIEMPSWVPPSGCGQKTRFNSFKYNWWDYLAEDLRYMFKIIPTEKPPEKCCEQEFWYCPSTGDTCGIKGSNGEIPILDNPKRSTVESECECDCENPIELDLQGNGFIFQMIDASSDDFKTGTILSRKTKSVFDGSTDRFNCDITVAGPTKIIVKIEYDSTVCGGDASEQINCGFREVSKITSVGSIKDLSGGANITSSDVLASSSMPATFEFTVGTPKYTDALQKVNYLESKIELRVDTNLERLNLCKGYSVSIAVMNVDEKITDEIKPKESNIKIPDQLLKLKDSVNNGIPWPKEEPFPEWANKAPPVTGTFPTEETGIPAKFTVIEKNEIVCPENYAPRNPQNVFDVTCRRINDSGQFVIIVPPNSSGIVEGQYDERTGNVFTYSSVTFSTKGAKGVSSLEVYPTASYSILTVIKISATDVAIKQDPLAAPREFIIEKGTETANRNNGINPYAAMWYDSKSIYINPDWEGEIRVYRREGQPEDDIPRPWKDLSKKIFNFFVSQGDVVCPPGYRKLEDTCNNLPYGVSCTPDPFPKCVPVSIGALGGTIYPTEVIGTLEFNTTAVQDTRVYYPTAIAAYWKIREVKIQIAESGDLSSYVTSLEQYKPKIIRKPPQTRIDQIPDSEADIIYDDRTIWVKPNLWGTLLIYTGERLTGGPGIIPMPADEIGLLDY